MRRLFIQLVSPRCETGAMLITSNRNVAEWGMVFVDTVVATAILDRLLHLMCSPSAAIATGVAPSEGVAHQAARR